MVNESKNAQINRYVSIKESFIYIPFSASEVENLTHKSQIDRWITTSYQFFLQRKYLYIRESCNTHLYLRNLIQFKTLKVNWYKQKYIKLIMFR